MHIRDIHCIWLARNIAFGRPLASVVCHPQEHVAKTFNVSDFELLMAVDLKIVVVAIILIWYMRA